MEHDINALTWPQCEGYLTIRPLDEGAARKVWLLQDESGQGHSVIKLIANHEAVASLRQIDRVAGAEHLIETRGIINTNLGPALMCEYCPGGSLGQMVAARGVLPLGEAITALAPIAQTLHALHTAGIRHGDISPNNILLTAEGMPKLADFQEARLLLEPAGTAGTPGFIAPEAQQETREAYGGAGDVYALGACLWFLLTGEVPPPPRYRGPVNLVLPDAPGMILDLLVDALQEDPGQRPDAAQFARTLFASGQAQPLNWSESVPGFATHLMATIHPQTSKGTRRGQRAGSKRRGGVHAVRGSAATVPANRLRPAPGSRRVLLAAVAGLTLVAGTGLGMRHWVHTSPPEPGTALQQANENQTGRSCAIQSDAQLPPCAQDSTVLLGELLELGSARDAALNAADPQALAEIYTPDSAQLASDVAMLEKLEELGLVIEGLHTTFAQLEVVARRYPDVVVVAGESSYGPYRYRGQGTRPVDHKVKRGVGEAMRFELRHGQDGWAISRVLQRESKGGTVENDDPTASRELSSRG